MTLLEAVRLVIVRHVSGISAFDVPGKLAKTLIAGDLNSTISLRKACQANGQIPAREFNRDNR